MAHHCLMNVLINCVKPQLQMSLNKKKHHFVNSWRRKEIQTSLDSKTFSVGTEILFGDSTAAKKKKCSTRICCRKIIVALWRVCRRVSVFVHNWLSSPGENFHTERANRSTFIKRKSVKMQRGKREIESCKKNCFRSFVVVMIMSQTHRRNQNKNEFFYGV